MVKKRTKQTRKLAKSDRLPLIEEELTNEISQCLMPVIRAVKAADGDEAVKWAADMQTADRVGFIYDKELSQLQGKS